MLAEKAKKLFKSRAPESEADVKIVKIGDYDAIPCIGAHVSSTKKVGKFKIISADYADGVLRIRYKLNGK